MPNGVLVLDKPRGMSSAFAVEAVKRRLGAKRAGHGGTLDPIATGVLAICLDEATKLAAYLLADDKAYEADLLLGVEMDTLDRTGTVTRTRPVEGITRERVLAVLAARTGEQEQVPPMFSALKVDGKRLYHRARAGEEIEREPRRIRIDRLDLLAFEPPVLRIAIACTKGTYVRSLIADIGNDLGCGAHMTELRRTRSGRFSIEQAHDLDRLDNVSLVPLVEATALPRITAVADVVTRIRNGLQLPPETVGVTPENYEKFLVLDEAGKLVAVCHVDGPKTVYDRVFLP